MKGIDIYEGDNIQDWNAIKNAGIEVVIQKATQGTTHIDKLLQYRYPKMKEAGVKVGFYHFANNTGDPEAQAEYFLNTITGLQSDTVLWLDIEAEENWNKQDAINFANQFIDYIQKQGHKIGVYSGESFYKDYLEGNILEVPLWIASYGKQPSLYPNCSWQYSENGQLNGIEGNVDLDYFQDNILINNTEVNKVETIVIYNYGPDMHSAEILADYLNCPTIANSRTFDYSCVKNVYAVGGKASQYTSYLTKLIAGSDRFTTDEAVADFIKNGGK